MALMENWKVCIWFIFNVVLRLANKLHFEPCASFSNFEEIYCAESSDDDDDDGEDEENLLARTFSLNRR